jgi:hypothetical protein
MEYDRNANFAQPLAKPLAVSVQPLSAGELVSDGNDFRTLKLWNLNVDKTAGPLGVTFSKNTGWGHFTIHGIGANVLFA